MSPKEFLYQARRTDIATVLKIATAFICTGTFVFTSGMQAQKIINKLDIITQVKKDTDENKKDITDLKSNQKEQGVKVEFLMQAVYPKNDNTVTQK